MIMQRFIDSALTDPDLRHLLRLALWLLVTGLAASATTVIAKVLTVTVAWRATNQLRTDLLSHLLSRDLLTLQSMSPGELAERVDGDVNQFQAFLSVFVIELVAGALLLIGIHIALLIVDWRLAIGLLAATIGLLVLSEWVRKKGVPLQRSLRESAGHLFGFVTDVITARVDIQTCGARDHVVRRLWGRLIRHYHADRRARLLGLLLLQTGSLTYALLNVVALATGAMMYIYGTATIGTAYALFRYVGMIRSPIERLVGELTSLQRAASAMSRLLELLQLQRSIVDGATRIPRPGASAPIAFEKVTFSYGRGVPALRNVTFHLESGMRLGVVGPSGGGKSTLLRLAARLIDPAEGAVRLGGTDLRVLRLQSLRAAVSGVVQSHNVLPGTIRENVELFAMRSISDADVTAACDDLGITRFVDRLSSRLDATLGVRIESLSPGEIQVLLLMRLYFNDSGIVLLDEPANMLDADTEELVGRALDRMLSGRTSIIVSHKRRTLKDADLILVLEGGAVTQFGPPSQLMRDRTSYFARFMDSDAGGRDD